MLKKIIWPLSIISILLSAIFIFGFVRSIDISSGEITDDVESSDDVEDIEDVDKIEDNMKDAKGDSEDMTSNDKSDILILGDSVGFGIGDEENLGLGERYVALMDEDSSSEMKISNISLPGHESPQLVDLLRSGEHDSSISNANLIIISIGGNDLNRLEYDDEVDLNIVFQKTLTSYRENLGLVVKKIRELNPDAQLAMVGLYDPYRQEDSEMTRFLLDWNYQTRLIVDSDPNFIYIPTYELFKYHLDQYLSPDNFHPSAAGYQAISEELYRILN